MNNNGNSKLDRIENLVLQLAEQNIATSRQMSEQNQAMVANTIATNQRVDKVIDDMKRLAELTQRDVNSIRNKIASMEKGMVNMQKAIAHLPQDVKDKIGFNQE